jgi:hypothetical protein
MLPDSGGYTGKASLLNGCLGESRSIALWDCRGDR